MANYVTVYIECPCGRLLGTKNVNAESRSISRGIKHCPACKRTVEYAVCGDRVSTNYKR